MDQTSVSQQKSPSSKWALFIFPFKSYLVPGLLSGFFLCFYANDIRAASAFLVALAINLSISLRLAFIARSTKRPSDLDSSLLRKKSEILFEFCFALAVIAVFISAVIFVKSNVGIKLASLTFAAFFAAMIPSDLWVEIYIIATRLAKSIHSPNSNKDSSSASSTSNIIISLYGNKAHQSIGSESLFSAQRKLVKAVLSSLTANFAELVIVATSVFGLAIFHMPPALTAIEIIALDLLILIAPIVSIAWGESRTSHNQSPIAQLIRPRTFSKTVFHGLIIAALAYANFLFFFIRRHISPQYLSATSPIYYESTTLTCLTIVFCQYCNLIILQLGKNGKLISNRRWLFKKLLPAICISIIVILNVLYNPIVNSYLSTKPLALSDWVTALLVSIIYLNVAMFHRHTKKHSRKEIVKLHKKVNSQKAAGSLRV